MVTDAGADNDVADADADVMTVPACLVGWLWMDGWNRALLRCQRR